MGKLTDANENVNMWNDTLVWQGKYQLRLPTG